MTGTIRARKPQPVEIKGEDEAYDLINDKDADFHPDEDIDDEETAGHVLNALDRMLAESDTAGTTYRALYDRQWILTTMESLAINWKL